MSPTYSTETRKSDERLQKPGVSSGTNVALLAHVTTFYTWVHPVRISRATTQPRGIFSLLWGPTGGSTWHDRRLEAKRAQAERGRGARNEGSVRAKSSAGRPMEEGAWTASEQARGWQEGRGKSRPANKSWTFSQQNFTTPQDPWTRMVETTMELPQGAHFCRVHLLNPHSNLMREVVITSQFYKWRNGYTERWSNLPQATRLESSGAAVPRFAVSGLNLLSHLPNIQIKGNLFIRPREKYPSESGDFLTSTPACCWQF